MSSEGNGWMREKMPVVTEWLDDLRRVFGREQVDEQIRRGMRGECTFHVRENGYEFGKPGPIGVQVSEIPKAKKEEGRR